MWNMWVMWVGPVIPTVFNSDLRVPEWLSRQQAERALELFHRGGAIQQKLRKGERLARQERRYVAAMDRAISGAPRRGTPLVVQGVFQPRGTFGLLSDAVPEHDDSHELCDGGYTIAKVGQIGDHGPHLAHFVCELPPSVPAIYVSALTADATLRYHLILARGTRFALLEGQNASTPISGAPLLGIEALPPAPFRRSRLEQRA